MDHVSTQNWPELIKEWQASGKSARAFCQEKEIPLNRFHYYKNKGLKKDNKKFAKIELTRHEESHYSSSSFSIRFPNGAFIELGPMSINELKELLR